MSNKLLMVANWKSYKTMDEAKDWFNQMKPSEVLNQVEMVVCPPFLFLSEAAKVVDKSGLNIGLGTQDISQFPFGAYTGAISTGMVKEFVDYAIVGHSERRKYFHETNQHVANKVSQCLEAGITPIVCVDKPYMSEQLAMFDNEVFSKIVVAYEPLSAIGSGNPETPEHAEQVADEIKGLTGVDTRVLYGGSVDAGNVGDYVTQDNIDGVLVGSKSLEASEWMSLVEVGWSVKT